MWSLLRVEFGFVLPFDEVRPLHASAGPVKSDTAKFSVGSTKSRDQAFVCGRESRRADEYPAPPRSNGSGRSLSLL